MIKFLVFAMVMVGCVKEKTKKEFVKPEKVSGYACTYNEEATARIFEDEKFKTGHSFCFQPSKDFVQVTDSCQKERRHVKFIQR